MTPTAIDNARTSKPTASAIPKILRSAVDGISFKNRKSYTQQRTTAKVMQQSDAAPSATLPLGRISLRPFEARDVEPCGRICYEAFRNVADRHGFPHDLPNAEVAAGMLSFLLETRGFYGVVAERDGVVAGSNWMDERNAVAGVGPVTVDPVIKDGGIGRRLMQDVIARSELQGSAGMRLVQVAYNVRSLSLYTKLGFAAREELVVLSGVPENP